MLGLVKAWKMAAIAAEKRLSKPGAKKAKGDQARIARAIRLLRRGAISRVGQLLENKGIGNMDNGEIWVKMKKKHPARKEQIKEEHYQFQPEEEIELKVGIILHKLDMNATPGPSGLRNGHLRLWT